MAKVITDNQHYADIAAAIRTKNETDTLYKPSEMAPAILEIQGGVELNFEVVGGTTRPSNPKENTIWVTTSDEIAGWVFSTEAPVDPVSGMVWFNTGMSGRKINAVSENVIELDFNGTQQYINGSWVKHPAMIYQVNEWLDFAEYLFAMGDEFESVTGGWGLYNSHSDKNLNPNGYYGIVENGIKIGLPKASEDYNWNTLEFSTEIPVDVTPYNVLSFKLVEKNLTSTRNSAYMFGLFANKSNFQPDMAACIDVFEISAPGYYEIPINECTGSFHIGGHVGHNGTTSGAIYYIVDEICLR